MNQAISLRRETPADYRAVENLTREAFWNQYKPGCDEHYLVHILRDSAAFIPELDFVAELDGKLVGHILYTNSMIALDAGGALPVITFGPISVLPALQKQGIGKALIAHTLGIAQQMGFPAVFIYGDPLYYSRSGFQPAEAYGIASEGNEYSAALQTVELQPGTLKHAQGRFIESPVYSIDAAAAEAFDHTFPPKEKLADTPGQRRFHEIIALHKPRR